MAMRMVLNRLLALLAIIGLIAGAVNVPANAMVSASSAMTMTGEMPCCPDKTMPDCGKTCPLIIMCFAPSLPATPAAFLPVRRDTMRLALAPDDESLVEGAASFPLRRPPRI